MLTTTLLVLSLQNIGCTAVTLPEQPIMGHRGSGKSNPDESFGENTIASFEHAFDEGAEYIELDVQLSQDGKVVVIHDFTVDKTTDRTGCVADFTYAVLATADATRGTGAVTAQGVPLLSDALHLVYTRGKKVNVELKVNSHDERDCPNTDVPALVTAVVAEVKGAGIAKDVLFSSFDMSAVKLAKAQLPEAKAGFLSADGGAVLVQQTQEAKAAGLNAIHPFYLSLTSDQGVWDSLKANGLQIIPWTVNDPAAMQTLFEGGVSALITDDVSAAIAARQAAPTKSKVSDLSCPEARLGDTDKGGCHASPEHSAPWMLAVVALLVILRLRRR